MQNNTIPKNTILNYLYSTDSSVSLEKLGIWLENKTNGQYKIIKIDNNIQAFTKILAPLNKNLHEE